MGTGTQDTPVSTGIAPPAGDIGGTTATPTVVGLGGLPILGTPIGGQVLEYDGVHYVPTTPSAGGALTNSSGLLAANFTPVTTVAQTFLTTSALAIGTWLVTIEAMLAVAASNDIAVTIAAGTATATFAGPQAAEYDNTATAQPGLPVSFTCIVTVTVAGTLVFRCSGGTAASGSILATSNGVGSTHVTGYTAVKIG
jgi:hypothetical protein